MSDQVDAARGHLSIGEVLSLLQDEFPDVTISKIRFLESQGLLDPERTPSGYRKFYDSDVARLRWILTQQKEHFLPLRVIRERLDELERSGSFAGGTVPVSTPGEPIVEEPAPAAEAARVTAPVAGRAPRRTPSLFASPPEMTETAPAPTAPETDPAAVPSRPRSTAAQGLRTPPSRPAGLTRSTRPAPQPQAVSLTRDELLSMAGIDAGLLDDLERFGLLAGRPMGRETLYDGEALVVAELARGFVRFGVEARHLRMYKVAAEREAGFLEQVIMPLVKQRNPEARSKATGQLTELADLGADLRATLLRQALRGYGM